MKIINIFILAISIIACNTQEIPRPAPKKPTDAEMCKPACEHLKELKGQDGAPGCLESRDLLMPDGTTLSCADYCYKRETEDLRALSPSCWITLTKCTDLEPLCRRR